MVQVPCPYLVPVSSYSNAYNYVSTERELSIVLILEIIDRPLSRNKVEAPVAIAGVPAKVCSVVFVLCYRGREGGHRIFCMTFTLKILVTTFTCTVRLSMDLALKDIITMNDSVKILLIAVNNSGYIELREFVSIKCTDF